MEAQVKSFTLNCMDFIYTLYSFLCSGSLPLSRETGAGIAIEESEL